MNSPDHHRQSAVSAESAQSSEGRSLPEIPQGAQSRYLSQRQLQAMTRLGDLLVPGGDGLPSFSASGSLHWVDELLQATPPADVRDLRLLLQLLYWLPDALLRGLLHLIERRERLPGLLATPLRLLNIGLKGIVFSLYYSNLSDPYRPAEQGSGVHQGLGYSLHCEPDSRGQTP